MTWSRNGPVGGLRVRDTSTITPVFPTTRGTPLFRIVTCEPGTQSLICDIAVSMRVALRDAWAGAGFVVALAGDIMTMPGLSKTLAAEAIRVRPDGTIEGLF